MIKRLALQLIAVTSSVLLALPYGWCCPSATEDPSSAAHPCCESEDPPDSRPSQPTPARQGDRCCCELDATPQRDNHQTSAPDFWAPLPPSVIVSIAGETTLINDGHVTHHGAGARLHALYCVWNC